MNNSIQSVEEKKGKETAVTEVRMLFQNPRIRKKTMVLIEGRDDYDCYACFFSDQNVYLYPKNIRFHFYITDTLTKQGHCVISIKDADFLHCNGDNQVCPNMFYTDAHDLETMLLQCGALKNMDNGMMKLVENIDVDSICRTLQNYSTIKWFNYNTHKNMDFRKVSVGELYKNGEMADICSLFERVRQMSGKSLVTYEEFADFLKNRKIESILALTNGHDLFECIYVEAKRMTRGNLDKKKFFKSIRKAFDVSMFMTTQLFIALKKWDDGHNENMFVSKIYENNFSLLTLKK